MDYISIKDVSKLWQIDSSRLGRLARKSRIESSKTAGGRTGKGKAEGKQFFDFRFS